MTIEQLAEASGVSGRAISDMERGHSRAPQERTLAALVDALRLDDGDRAGLTAWARAERSSSRVGRPRVGELPRGVGAFVGRVPESASLRRHALAAAAGGRTLVAVVYGPPGIGKTAFAVRAAGQLRESFTDGQVYLDLRGTDPVPMAVGEAAARLLRALDVNPRSIADDEQERAGQLRAVLRERRCLLVLDNAADEGQVRPLLPGAGAATVVVTSRRLLSGLDAVLRIGLAPLAPAESAGLLRAIAGEAADQAAGDDVHAVARLCGHLPLALRIAGTRLASRPGWTMGHLAQRLSDEDRRLDHLVVGDLGVTAAFALSYAQLSDPAKVMFRRLAHVPGPDFAAPLAAVLAQVDLCGAEQRLDELVELGLLQPAGLDRYRFHDLIRLFATDRLRDEEPAPARAATERRMVDRLLDTAVVAGRWFAPAPGDRRGLVPLATPDDRGLVPLTTPEDAQHWLQAEAAGWLAALRSAADAGRHRRVVEVAEALHWYADRDVHGGPWPEVYRLSRDAAARLADRRQEIAHLKYHAWAVGVCARRHDESAALATAAYRLAAALGDPKEQADALHHTARAWRSGGQHAKALGAYRRALDLAGAAGDHDGYVQLRVAVAQTFVELGRFGEALEEFRAALREVDARPVAPGPAEVAQVTARAALAWLLVELERWPEALDQATRALLPAAGYGARFTGRIHLTLGRAHAGLGATDRARAHLTRAIGLLADGPQSGPAETGSASTPESQPPCPRRLCEVESPAWAWHQGVALYAHVGGHCAHHRAGAVRLARSALAALAG